jgi:nucleotide-binding universal stress UspA family protein
MSRRIVIGLGGSVYADNALAFAIRRIQLFGGVLIGVSAVDSEYIERSEQGVQPGAFEISQVSAAVRMAEARERALAHLDAFAVRCDAAGIQHEDVLNTGSPFRIIEQECKTADLLVIGMQTFFRWPSTNTSDGTLEELLKYPACPIVAIPGKLEMPQHVLLAYDGGVGAARALNAYLHITPNLPEQYQVTLLCVAEEWEQHKVMLEKMANYIREFGIKPILQVRAGRPADVIRLVARELRPALVIVGSPPVRNLADRLFGSVTHNVLKDGSFPVFLYH